MYKNSKRDEVYNRSMSFFLPIFFIILGLPFTYTTGHHRHNIIHIIEDMMNTFPLENIDQVKTYSATVKKLFLTALSQELLW